MKRYKNKDHQGFTIVELLVVISIIALFSSIALIALMSARQRARDTRRAGDIAAMASVLELYFNTNKGYPSSTNGIPDDLNGLAVTIPSAPQPPEPGCNVDNPVTNQPANNYYYIPSGTPYNLGGKWFYPDYSYYFCIGYKTGDLTPGIHHMTSKGIRTP